MERVGAKLPSSSGAHRPPRPSDWPRGERASKLERHYRSAQNVFDYYCIGRNLTTTSVLDLASCFVSDGDTDSTNEHTAAVLAFQTEQQSCLAGELSGPASKRASQSASRRASGLAGESRRNRDHDGDASPMRRTCRRVSSNSAYETPLWCPIAS